MTSKVLGAGGVEAFDDTFVSESDIESLEIPSESASAVFKFSKDGSGLHIAPAEGNKGAIGAVTAIFLEIAAGFGIYCIWHFWHMFR